MSTAEVGSRVAVFHRCGFQPISAIDGEQLGVNELHLRLKGTTVCLAQCETECCSLFPCRGQERGQRCVIWDERMERWELRGDKLH